MVTQKSYANNNELYPSDRYAYKTNESDPIYIPANRIQTPYQTEDALNEEKVKENLKAIKKGKALKPVVVGYKYDLHDGHHGLEAAKRAGHTHVPCVVGGRNERRVKAAEKRYRKVWKSMSGVTIESGRLLVKKTTDKQQRQDEKAAQKKLRNIQQILSVAEEHETAEIDGIKKPTSDRQQRKDDLKAINILDQIENVFKDGARGEEMEIRAKKSFIDKNGRLLVKKLSGKLASKVKRGDAHWVTVKSGPLEGRHLLIDGSRPTDGKKSTGKILAGHGIPTHVIEKITGATHAHHSEHEQDIMPGDIIRSESGIMHRVHHKDEQGNLKVRELTHNGQKSKKLLDIKKEHTGVYKPVLDKEELAHAKGIERHAINQREFQSDDTVRDQHRDYQVIGHGENGRLKVRITREFGKPVQDGKEVNIPARAVGDLQLVKPSEGKHEQSDAANKKLPTLKGSEKQVAWADKIRKEIIDEIKMHIQTADRKIKMESSGTFLSPVAAMHHRDKTPSLKSGKEDLEKVLGKVESIPSAKWFIENRNGMWKMSLNCQGAISKVQK